MSYIRGWFDSKKAYNTHHRERGEIADCLRKRLRAEMAETIQLADIEEFKHKRGEIHRWPEKG